LIDSQRNFANSVRVQCATQDAKGSTRGYIYFHLRRYTISIFQSRENTWRLNCKSAASIDARIQGAITVHQIPLSHPISRKHLALHGFDRRLRKN